MDFSKYNSPGVYTESIPGPLIGVQNSTPKSVGIFGKGRGYRIDLETLVIPSDFVDPDDSSITAVLTPALRQQGISTSTIKVINSASGVTYTPQTVTSPPNGDYVIVVTNGPSGVTNGPDSTVKIKRVIGSTLADETTVQISYQYTDATYFQPQRFFDYDDVVDFYGSPFDTSGAISSELTLACNLAFTNGAQTIVAVAASGSGSLQASDYIAALAKLEGIEEIAVVVPAIGNTNVFAAVRDHVNLQSSQKSERRAILGTDGSASAISSSNRITQAQSLASSRVLLVSPSTVKYYNSQISQVQTLGSQYSAAALAGVAVTLNPAVPLTRKPIAGFVGIETASDAQKSQETAAGLCVIESVAGGNLRVRHGVTTNPQTLITREWNVLGQQDAMSYRLRNSFEADGLIGSIVSDFTLANVKASAATALESLVSDGVIQGYKALKVRQQSANLDAIEISFEWQAALPLNYVVVRFTINVSSGDVSTSSSI